MLELESVSIKVPNKFLSYSLLGKLGGDPKLHQYIKVLTLSDNLIKKPDMILKKLQDDVHLIRDNSPPLPSNSATALVSTTDKTYKIIYYSTNGKHNNKSTSHTKNKCWEENPHLKPIHKDNKQTKLEANSYLAKALITSVTTVPEDQLILDCGATHHMFNSQKLFLSLSDPTNIPVMTGNTNSSLKAGGVGKVSLLCDSRPLELDDCLYVPNLNCNLISLLALFKNKLTINRSNNMFPIELNNFTLLSGRIINQLMHVNHTLPKAHLTVTSNNLWSQRLRHPGPAFLKKLGLPTNNAMCTVCELNKAHKQPFNKKFEDALSPLDCVHINLLAPAGERGALLGYKNNNTSYRILWLHDKKVAITKHATFDKTSFPSLNQDHSPADITTDQQCFTIGKTNPITASGEPQELNNQSPPLEMAEEPHAEEGLPTETRIEAPQATRIRVIGPQHPTLVNSNIDNLNILPYSQRANILLTSDIQSSTLLGQLRLIERGY
ncbi:hypothetical protein O181_105514 [Austropuccinia psidii MF-1]|uniref:GAG-pre-integrase domain-containing protein n=1 Tax=Austropuccinia psidii MF-1 TaxID=1389203 RepID=A0A9Q3JPJ3_9BASI|nr:hypothetical protein [Austropuccinia psidii MF-1]